MKRFVPIRAEGALVLGLVGLIAGTTYAINELSAPTVTTRTVVGTSEVRIKQVDDKGGVKPGPVVPREVQQQPVVAQPETGFAPAPAPTPLAPPKKTVVATTPDPAVATPEPNEEPGGGVLPGTEPGGTDPGSGTNPGGGTNTGGSNPGGGTNTGGGSNPGGGTKPGCLLAPLCAPGSPSVAPTSAPE